jgi:hypothetical protein
VGRGMDLAVASSLPAGAGMSCDGVDGRKVSELKGPAKLTSCYIEIFGMEPTAFHTAPGAARNH